MDLKGRRILEEVKQRLIDQFQPQAIILFGSYAWGEPNADSDLDLLVVKDGAETNHQMGVAARMLLSGVDHPLDILVYKPEELKQKTNWFFRKIFRDGELIYGRL